MATTDNGLLQGASSKEGRSATRLHHLTTTTFAEKPMQWGVTLPITYEKPKQVDLDRTLELESFLRKCDCFESEEGHALRERVLVELEAMINEWMAMAVYPEPIAGYEAQLFPFGSYQLGVTMPESDIDLCCVIHPTLNISRHQFFVEFGGQLRIDSRVSKLVMVPHAHTPVMKLKFRGVDLDLLLCILQDPPKFTRPGRLTHIDLSVDDILIAADDQAARSINGVRVATKTLQLVPNISTFRLALRFVKYWARNRGVYSNILGYLGGVSYAILVARICQLYPNFAASQIVTRFFKIYQSWNWSKPVHLCAMEGVKEGLEHLTVWSPSSDTGTVRGQVMPIVTPAYPIMNSSHNVSQLTKRHMLSEISRCQSLLSNDPNTSFSVLARPMNIFKHYDQYVIIEMYGCSLTSFEAWTGFLESKLRSYVHDLGNSPVLSDARVYPERVPLDRVLQRESVSPSMHEDQIDEASGERCASESSELVSLVVGPPQSSLTTTTESAVKTAFDVPTEIGPMVKRVKLSLSDSVSRVEPKVESEEGRTREGITQNDSTDNVPVKTSLESQMEYMQRLFGFQDHVHTDDPSANASNPLLTNMFSASATHWMDPDIAETLPGYRYGAAVVIGIRADFETMHSFGNTRVVDLSTSTLEFFHTMNTLWPDSILYEDLVTARIRGFQKHELPSYVQYCPLIWAESTERAECTELDGEDGR